MFFQTFLFVVITSSALIIPCASQWVSVDPDMLDCKRQKNHQDCTFICACGWCEKKGCFDWPGERHRSQAYRDAFSVCNVTERSDIKTHYYTTKCKQERGFFIFLGFLLTIVAFSLVFTVVGSFLACVVVICKYFLCEFRRGYMAIP